MSKLLKNFDIDINKAIVFMMSFYKYYVFVILISLLSSTMYASSNLYPRRFTVSGEIIFTQSVNEIINRTINSIPSSLTFKEEFHKNIVSYFDSVSSDSNLNYSSQDVIVSSSHRQENYFIISLTSPSSEFIFEIYEIAVLTLIEVSSNFTFLKDRIIQSTIPSSLFSTEVNKLKFISLSTLFLLIGFMYISIIYAFYFDLILEPADVKIKKHKVQTFKFDKFIKYIFNYNYPLVLINKLNWYYKIKFLLLINRFFKPSKINLFSFFTAKFLIIKRHNDSFSCTNISRISKLNKASIDDAHYLISKHSSLQKNILDEKMKIIFLE